MFPSQIVQFSLAGELQYSQLTHFKLAQSYLDQKPVACWEDIVSVLCVLKQRSQAVEVSKKHKVDYTNIKPCSLKPGVD